MCKRCVCFTGVGQREHAGHMLYQGDTSLIAPDKGSRVTREDADGVVTAGFAKTRAIYTETVYHKPFVKRYLDVG
jgi:hypothetical protein